MKKVLAKVLLQGFLIHRIILNNIQKIVSYVRLMIKSSCQVSGNIAQLNSVVESMKSVDALYKEKEKAIKVFLDQ